MSHSSQPALKEKPLHDHYDAVIVGSGPNGLSAAIALAEKGKKVVVLEAEKIAGGGMRSMELTLPGFTHDLCSAVHPLALASPFLKSLPLEKFGLEWIHSPIALAHPLDDGDVIVAHKNFEKTCHELGIDAKTYRRIFKPFLRRADEIFQSTLRPLQFPRSPLLLSRLALRILPPAEKLRKHFQTARGQALIAGLCAHSTLPLEEPLSAGAGVMLTLALHGYGWPFPKGGAQSLTNALIAYLESLGGEIIVNHRVSSMKDIPPAKVILFDTSPRALCDIAGQRVEQNYKKKIKAYRYGPSVFKIDWALKEPIPWKNEECGKAGTVHIGGTYEEIAKSERNCWNKKISDRPFIILTQPSLFDDTRAPKGKHTAWAYCHVPHGSTVDMTDAIEKQIERFAPGFQKTILKKSVMFPADIESHNANNIGGDITGGVLNLKQFFARPILQRDPYATSDPSIFLCSASTPPGPGVHGMCGYFAAQSALKVLK